MTVTTRCVRTECSVHISNVRVEINVLAGTVIAAAGNGAIATKQAAVELAAEALTAEYAVGNTGTELEAAFVDVVHDGEVEVVPGPLLGMRVVMTAAVRVHPRLRPAQGNQVVAGVVEAGVRIGCCFFSELLGGTLQLLGGPGSQRQDQVQ